ncbi:CPBP family intramembrane metalloprotease [Dysgonomonas sp. Marseille-P4677]|uniref:CPBP family intramembrane glutamic endopeptidase n=1 Tax=Dysgonomonas sp. Marseille-P4677 TaxID=2364790 RepID=UPI0019115F9E|nr:type II CAAX endopeptidase family protein [Dysgonomonas sp. Marseille-P4677]MBK5722014.1 CPBP family intramembrane metalloprotease [Dysgonomonas sp. Marseille-P4677]
MKSLLIKHPVITYCLVCLLFTVLLGIANMFLFPSSVDYMLLFPQWAPTLSAILIVCTISKRSEIRILFQGLSLRKSNLKWSCIAVVIPILTCGISYIILSLSEYKQWTSPELNRSFGNYIICLFAIILGSCGEEIGCRGFMLSQLNKKYTLFVSSLFVGLYWGLWHLKFHSGILIFFLYAFLVIEFSLIISWLWSKTRNNIISAIIFHSSVNLCSLIFFENIISDPSNHHLQILLYGIYVSVFTIPCIFIVKNMLLAQRLSNKENNLK